MNAWSILTIFIACFYLVNSQSRHNKRQFDSVRFESYSKPEQKHIGKTHKHYSSRLINEKPVTFISSSTISRNSQNIENEFEHDESLALNKEEDNFLFGGTQENKNSSLLTNGLEVFDRLFLDGGATETTGFGLAALVGGVVVLTIIFPFIAIPLLLIFKLFMVLPMVKIFELPDVGAGSPNSYVDALTRLFAGMNMNGEGSIFAKNSTQNNNGGNNNGGNNVGAFGRLGSTGNNEISPNLFTRLFTGRRTRRSAPQANCIEKLRCIFIKQEKDCSKYKCFPEKPTPTISTTQKPTFKRTKIVNVEVH